ncbi:MAG: hypothetical protein AAF493_12605 [Pseudomonadota bacterium]
MSFSDRLATLLATARERAEQMAQQKIDPATTLAREYFQFEPAGEEDEPAPPPPPITVAPEPEPVRRAAPRSGSQHFLSSLRDPNTIRTAVIWAEILDKPVALRPRRGRRVR